MKKINVILVMLLVCVGTTVMAQKKTKAFDSKEYALFGDKFKVTKIYTKDEMLKKYKALKKGDTLVVQFQSNIKAVCNSFLVRISRKTSVSVGTVLSHNFF